MADTQELQRMLDQAQKAVQSAHPNEKDVQKISHNIDTLNSSITQLTDALSKLRSEQQKLVAEVGDVQGTKHAHQVQQQGDKIMKQLIMSKKALAQTYASLQAELHHQTSSIAKQRSLLQSNNQQMNEQKKDIKNKIDLLATRDRMLQLSQERPTVAHMMLCLANIFEVI